MHKFLILILLCLCQATYANIPILTVQSGNITKHYSRDTLLTDPRLEQITISNNRAYPGKTMTYDAIKLCDLLSAWQVNNTDTLEFSAADNFHVLIPAAKLTTCNANSSIAYLAIEPKTKWPLINNDTHTTAGPFDVIWLRPEKSLISDEYWAWSVVKITIHKKLDPNIYGAPPPVSDKEVTAQIRQGYHIYISHCAACHSMNGIGKGKIGPDLNIPKNPVEYYPDDQQLRQFIRDPQSMRKIPHDRMSGSNKQFLPDNELDNLISYFHYMVKHKKTTNSQD